MMEQFSLSKVYQLLEGGPVVLLATALKGRPNVMAMSWHMMADFTPPLVACVVDEHSLSFAALRRTGECVIAIPARRLGAKVVGVGGVSGRKVDKFKKFGLTPLKASRVKAPLIAECFANFECKVRDTRLAAKYNIFILEVVKAWRDPSQKDPKTLHHQGRDRFVVDGPTIRLRSKVK